MPLLLAFVLASLVFLSHRSWKAELPLSLKDGAPLLLDPARMVAALSLKDGAPLLLDPARMVAVPLSLKDASPGATSGTTRPPTHSGSVSAVEVAPSSSGRRRHHPGGVEQ